MSTDKSDSLQRATCLRFNAEFVRADRGMKLGIADGIREGLLPINGLRHRPVGDSSGWYLWAGEKLSDATDFFVPLHIEHLDEWCPRIQKYLGLAPGWRFLVADDYEDVWFDPQLLEVQ